MNNSKGKGRGNRKPLPAGVWVLGNFIAVTLIGAGIAVLLWVTVPAVNSTTDKAIVTLIVALFCTAAAWLTLPRE